MEDLNNIWKIYDKIWVITTSDSKIINETIENLRKHGINEIEVKVNERVMKKNVSENCGFFDSILFSNKCFTKLAHQLFQTNINILQNAQDNGYKNILIFEDDARFINTKNIFKKLYRINKWLENNTKWETFHYGGISHKLPFSVPKTKDIAYAPEIFLGHAVSYSERGIKKILNNYKKYINNTHFDKFVSTVCNKKYFSYPNVNYQVNAPAMVIKNLHYYGTNKIIKDETFFNFIINLCDTVVFFSIPIIILLIIITIYIIISIKKKRKKFIEIK